LILEVIEKSKVESQMPERRLDIEKNNKMEYHGYLNSHKILSLKKIALIN
jgi:hypothetical protein